MYGSQFLPQEKKHALVNHAFVIDKGQNDYIKCKKYDSHNYDKSKYDIITRIKVKIITKKVKMDNYDKVFLTFCV